MMILFLLGSSLVTGGSVIAKQDSWVCIILAALVAVPVVLIYAGLYRAAPGQDLFDMAYSAFGKIIGPIITALFSLYTIHLGALVIRNFSEYFQVVSIPETPQAVTATCIGLIALYNIVKGIEVPARGSKFILPFTLVVIVFLNAVSFKYMDFNNLKPVLNQDLPTILKGAYSVFVFPFGEIVMFVTVLAMVERQSKPAKLYISAVLFSGLLLTLLVVVAIAMLGFPIVASLYFPSYSAASIIDIGDFLSRIEVLVSGNYIIFGVVKVSLCLYVGCKGISKLFGIKNHKKTAAPIIAVMIIVSVLVYENTMQMFDFLHIYELYAPFFQIVIPVALLITLKAKLKNNKPQAPEQVAADSEAQATSLPGGEPSR